jgi:hypothetical protein
MRGWNLMGNGTLSAQGNIEEFIAIMVTNIFISDVTNRYKTGLRADWTGHAGPVGHVDVLVFRLKRLLGPGFACKPSGPGGYRMRRST